MATCSLPTPCAAMKAQPPTPLRSPATRRCYGHLRITASPPWLAWRSSSMSKQLGRNKIAQDAHFRKAGPTEKTGHEKIKAERQADKLEEQDALREAQIPEEA